jgi:hypothetical protein
LCRARRHPDTEVFTAHVLSLNAQTGGNGQLLLLDLGVTTQRINFLSLSRACADRALTVPQKLPKSGLSRTQSARNRTTIGGMADGLTRLGFWPTTIVWRIIDASAGGIRGICGFGLIIRLHGLLPPSSGLLRHATELFFQVRSELRTAIICIRIGHLASAPRMVAAEQLCGPEFRISSDFQRQPLARSRGDGVAWGKLG